MRASREPADVRDGRIRLLVHVSELGCVLKRRENDIGVWMVVAALPARSRDDLQGLDAFEYLGVEGMTRAVVREHERPNAIEVRAVVTQKIVTEQPIGQRSISGRQPSRSRSVRS